MKTNLFSVLITDCLDDNARGRQLARLSTLLPCATAFVGVNSDLEAAGNLIDALDAGGGNEGIILVNVAPRQHVQEKWENGTPFGYFWFEKTLVVATIDGRTLSLVKKLDLAKSVYVLDIPTIVEIMFRNGIVSKGEAAHIKETQFRSFEFLPRVAAYLLTEKKLPAKELPLSTIENAPSAIWWIDNFGNCKTTLLQREVTIKSDGKIDLTIGALPYIAHLRDVADGTAAVTEGSSGMVGKRFLEITVQGKDAAAELNLFSGMEVL